MDMPDINKLNQKMKNGFVFDMNHFMNHKEKAAIKAIRIDKTNCLTAQLSYNENWRKNCKEIVLWLNLWYQAGSGMMVTYGQGKNIVIETNVDRASFNRLIGYTAHFDEARIKQLAEENKIQLNNDKIL